MLSLRKRVVLRSASDTIPNYCDKVSSCAIESGTDTPHMCILVLGMGYAQRRPELPLYLAGSRQSRGNAREQRTRFAEGHKTQSTTGQFVRILI